MSLVEYLHTSIRKQSMSPSIDRTKLFGRLDDFTNTMENQKLLVNPECKRNRPCGLCVSEVITILVLFHFSHFRTFKHFYQFCLRYNRADFPGCRPTLASWSGSALR